MSAQILPKINRYFRGLNAEAVKKLDESFHREVKKHNVRYLNDEGSARDIQLVLRPWLFGREQAAFLHRIIYRLKASQHKLFLLYLKEKAIQEMLPLHPKEKEWFSLINKSRPQKYQTVFGRWDTNVVFNLKNRHPRQIKFLETNTVGIGGIHYIPAVSEALKAALHHQLEKQVLPYRFDHQPDPRQLLAQEIKQHARLIGRKRLNVAFMENREYLGGTVELAELTQYFLRLGINAILTDPRDLKLKGKEIYGKGKNIDIIYRDSELEELIELEEKGHSMSALKQAFINNQVISSISGELDHKSAFAIFTDPRFDRFFTVGERALFKKYIAWTRILKEGMTCDTQLRKIGLVPYTIKNKDKLIIKPNRAYGGEGVLIGKSATKKEWQDYVKKAADNPGDFVVQELVKIEQEEFPFFNSRHRIEFDKFYAVSGIVVTRNSIAVLGRFSKNMVVNVAKKGGIIPTLQLR